MLVFLRDTQLPISTIYQPLNSERLGAFMQGFHYLQ